jgi:SAM-dependent methyltransferase
MGNSALITQTKRSDVWVAGDAYEPYVGRWSRLVARHFIDWLGLPEGKRWLDVGCGTGALTQEVLARADPAAVIGVDSSQGFVAHARAHTQDRRAEFQIGDAQALPFVEREFDAVVSGLVLNFVDRPERALAEMKRVLRPGGAAAVYVWDYAGEMQLMRHFWSAAVSLDPQAGKLDEGRRFPICNEATLLALFDQCGFAQTEVRALDVPTVFKDFDDYWSPFLGGQGPAPTYACTLSEQQRQQLRARLQETLPTEPDGSIRLIARAFAVCGRRPQ